MYLHSMAHDVRTPLVSIVCSNENLMQLITDPEQLQMVQLSDSATYILLIMFDQIAELSKLKFDQLVIKTSYFNLRALILKLFNRMRIQAEF